MRTDARETRKVEAPRVGAHARARDILGRGASARVVALNLGVAFLVAGGPLAWSPPIVIGLALAVGSSLASVVTFLLAAADRRFDVTGGEAPRRPSNVDTDSAGALR